MSENGLASIAQDERICLDYIDVLSTLCKKQWSFSDAVYGVMPIFGMVLKPSASADVSSRERLYTLALQVLSTQVSDETNIIRLIVLARQQGFPELDIQLPYPLTSTQLATIEQACPGELQLSQCNELLSITLR